MLFYLPFFNIKLEFNPHIAFCQAGNHKRGRFLYNSQFSGFVIWGGVGNNIDVVGKLRGGQGGRRSGRDEVKIRCINGFYEWHCPTASNWSAV